MPNTLQLTVDVISRNQGELDQVSNRLRDIEQRSNEARRETLQYRDAIAELNREFARNASTLQHADGIAREQLQTRQRQIRAEQGLLRARREQSTLTLASLTQERRELGALTGAFGNATRGAGLFNRAGAELAGTLGAIGISEVVFGLQRFAVEAARTSIQIDSQRRALEVLTGSAEEAAQQFEELKALAREPGLQFRQASQGVVALRAIGVEAETTTRILRELANAAAFSGGSGEFERGLLGFRQIIQRGRISQEELNQLTENLGLVSRAISEEFGTVLAEEIQAELDRTGQSVDDFVERTLTALERLERFPLDAPSVALKNLNESFTLFQAAVGDTFLPVIAEGAEGLTVFLDTVTRFISIADNAAEAAQRFNLSIVSSDDILERDDALQARIRGLRELIAEQERAARTSGVFQDRGTLEARAEGSRAELAELERIEEGDPEKIRELGEELAGLHAELTRINDAQTRLNEASAISQFFSQFSPENLHSLEQADIAINEQIDSTEALLAIAEAAAQGIADAARDRTAHEEALAESLRTQVIGFREYDGVLSEVDTRLLTFTERAAALAGAIRELPPELTAVRMEFDVLAPTAARVAEVFRNVQTAVVDTAEEQRALNLVNSELHGGLLPTAEALQLTAHNAALVNPAISQAVDSIRDYNDVLLEAGINYRTVEEISESVRASAGDQASAFDDLRRSVDGVTEASGQLPGELLDIGDALDQIDVSAQATRGELSLTTGLLETLANNSDIFGDIAITAFDALSASVLQTAGNIDTVGESIASVSDLAARISLGDLTALADLPFRVNSIIQEQNALAAAGRQQRRDESIDERTVTGARDRNLATAARALNIDFGQLDISEATHFADQGPISLNDFSETALDILSRNLMAGVSDIAGGLEAGIQQALDATDIEEPIARGILTLVASLEEDLTAIDIAGIFQPEIAALEERVAEVAASLRFAELTDDDNAFQAALQESIQANTDYYNRRIEAANLQMRLFGESIENADELNRVLQEMNNAIRLQLEPVEFNLQQANARVEAARRTAERTGTDRQAIEDVARQQYGAAAYDAEVAAASEAATSAAEAAAEAAREAAEADAAMMTARTAAEAARSEIEAAAIEARRIADSAELILRDQFGNRTDVRGDIILPENIQEERRRTTSGATQTLEMLLRERQEQIAREREAEAEAFDFEAVLEGFLSASEASTEQISVDIGNLNAPLENINTGVSDTVSAVREVVAQMSPLESINSGIINVVSAVHALSADLSSGLNINLSVDGTAQTGFHSVIADQHAYEAGVRAQEAMLYGRGATTSQEQQYAHQSAADFSQNFGRGFSSGGGAQGFGGGFPDNRPIVLELDFGDEVIRAVTRRQIQTQDRGDNWNF